MCTYLSHEIESAGDLGAQYDEHVKRLLKDKGVLAFIMVYVIAEFKDYTLEDAKSAIDGEPEVAVHPVRPKEKDVPEAIRGDSTESKLPGEGTVTFDIVFHVHTLNGERKKIIINVEAQADFHPGYDLVSRGIFYAARLVSEQMDTEFTAKDYDVKEVYSIWICMDTPQTRSTGESVADTIVKYSIQPQVMYCGNGDAGNVSTGRYDLLSVVFICLQDDEKHRSSNELIGMLSTLLSDRLSVEEKKNLLEKEYGFPMTKKMKEEATIMCNISRNIAADKEQKIKEVEKERDQLSAKNDQLSAENDQLSAEKAEMAARIKELEEQLRGKQ